MLRSRRGLTVLELVIIIIIIGVLLLIAVPRFTAPTLVSMAAPDSVVAPNATGEVAVKVTSRRGAPQPGVKIQFEATGRGTVTPEEVVTDSTGTARATWRATADTGALRIIAHPSGKTTPEVELKSRVMGVVTAAPATPVPAAAQTLDSTAAKKDSSAATTGAASASPGTKTPAQTPANTPPATKRP
jgi:hypothetical protein